MKEHLRSLGKAYDRQLSSLAQKADGGESITPKAAEVLNYLEGAKAWNTINSLLEDVKEHGGLEGLVGMLTGGHHSKRQIGFDTGTGGDHKYPWMEHFEGIIPAAAHLYNTMESRRGVPGTGPYGDRRKRRRTRAEAEYDIHDYDDMMEEHDEHDIAEARRRRSPRTGRYIKSEHYDNMDMRHAADRAVSEAMARHTHGMVSPGTHSAIHPHHPTMTMAAVPHTMAYPHNAAYPHSASPHSAGSHVPVTETADHESRRHRADGREAATDGTHSRRG